MDNKTHTSNERIWAALAHASGLLFFFGLAPLLIWSTQRRKSSYVAFHALQALGFQVISIVLWMLFSIVLPLVFVLLLIPVSMLVVQFQPDTGTLDILMPFLMMILIFVPILAIFGAYFLTCILGSAFVFMGKDFRYPVLGNWLARYLHYLPEDTKNSLNDEAQERWVAGLGHASLVMLFLGLFVPAAAWLAEKNRSALIRFQALQALIYQGIGLIGYFLSQFIYLVFYLLFMGTMIFAGVQSDKFTASPVIAGVGVLFVLVMFCFAGISLVVMPIYTLLGLFASMRVISGHNFKYPLLGSMIWKRQNKPALVSVQAGGGQDVNHG